MSTSILDSVKKTLGIDNEYLVFDPDILMHINTAFSILEQIGIGPQNGFTVEDSFNSWSEVIGGDPRLNSVKTYVYLRVKLLFDPPVTSFLIAALQEQVRELEWRLSTTREVESWIPPVD